MNEHTHVPINPLTKKVGIIGALGDLGSQLATLERSKDREIVICDHKDINLATIDTVMRTCEIVHFCVPEGAFKRPIRVRQGQIVVLHDSVMAVSKRINQTFFSHKAHIVHMLMNTTQTVIIDSQSRSSLLEHHMKSIGCVVRRMSTIDHDTLMARSQAPLALLVTILLDDLRSWQKNALLANSGEILLQTLESRAVAWTPPTLQTILKNPEITLLIDDMKRIIHKE